MPRTLKFLFKDLEIPAILVGFSRDSVYGKKTIERRGEDGTVYLMVNLTADGTHVIPPRGMSASYIDQGEGKRVNQNEIQYVDEEQEPLFVTRSMYKQPIVLGQVVVLNNLFGYDIERTYVLQLEDSDQFDMLLKECKELLADNKFLRFTYAYFDTVDPQDAILVPKEDAI
ncbi:MAG: hypothetical protein ACFE96_04795, partial [Candidatus Hermodarchaeota archaeon]